METRHLSPLFYTIIRAQFVSGGDDSSGGGDCGDDCSGGGGDCGDDCSGGGDDSSEQMLDLQQADQLRKALLMLPMPGSKLLLQFSLNTS